MQSRNRNLSRYMNRDGLFLLVNPGGSKLWRWRYRFDGKEKLMALGEYPIVSLAQARERQFAERKKLEAGIDPMAERPAEPRRNLGSEQQRRCSAKPKAALRRLPASGGNGGPSANLPATRIMFCGAWKPTYFRLLDTSSLTT